MVLALLGVLIWKTTHNKTGKLAREVDSGHVFKAYPFKARRVGVQTGVEGLRGEVGTVERPLAPEGTVFVHGEIWRAVHAGGPVASGTRVRVVGVRDMVVDVEPVDAPR